MAGVSKKEEELKVRLVKKAGKNRKREVIQDGCFARVLELD